MRVSAHADLADIPMDTVGRSKQLVVFVELDVRSLVVVGGIRKGLEAWIGGNRGKIRIKKSLKRPLQEYLVPVDRRNDLGAARIERDPNPTHNGKIGCHSQATCYPYASLAQPCCLNPTGARPAPSPQRSNPHAEAAVTFN